MLMHGTYINTNVTCECNIYTPSLAVFRQKQHVQWIGGNLVSLDMSGDETVDWACNQLLNGHTGSLFDHNGVKQDLRGDTAVFDRYTRNDDLKSFVVRTKRFAVNRRQRRMRADAIDPYTFFDWAIKAHICATFGPCCELAISDLSMCANSARNCNESLPSSPASKPAEGWDDE